MPSPHTGENIHDLVEQVLDEWDIHPSKLLATLTDNESNMLATFRPKTSDSDVDDNGDSDSSVEEDELPTDVPAQVLDFDERQFDHELLCSHITASGPEIL